MGFNRGPKIVTDGLVLYLDAANQKSYPGTGTTWSDLSGNGNNGTLVNGPTFNSDNLGSLVFDGVNDLVLIPSSSLSSPSQLTIEILFKRNGVLSQGVGCPIHRNDGSNGNVGNSEFTIAVWKDNSNYIYGSIGANGGSTWTNGYTGVICELNRYYHVITSWNGTTVKTYVDGDLKVTYNFSNYTNSSGKIRVGSSTDTGSVYQWAGNIPSFKIYNRAFSDVEVLQNYNATKSRFGL